MKVSTDIQLKHFLELGTALSLRQIQHCHCTLTPQHWHALQASQYRVPWPTSSRACYWLTALWIQNNVVSQELDDEEEDDYG